MTTTAETILTNQTLAVLAGVYNSYAETPVTKFKDKPTAVKRVLALATQLGREVAPTDSGFDLVEPKAELLEDEKIADPDFARKCAEADAKAKPETEPKPEVKTPKTPEQVTKTVAEKPAKKAEAAFELKRRGPAPRFEDTDVIATVADNPRRKGCKSFERYALYTPGMTVGAYLDAANKKFGTATKDRDFWRVDVRWDVDAGHIQISKAG